MTSVYYRRQDYLPRWTRGQRRDWHVGMMAPTFFYLWAKFRQKEKLKLFKIRKLNGFGGFQSPDVRKIIIRNR
jgi:hypothetical protein